MTHRKKLLIIEDETSLIKAQHDKFEREGFKVVEAKNGEEGLSTALRELPDLILLDLLMPVMDGMTMLKKLRAENEWGKTVPVIILTNLASDTDEQIQNIVETEPSYYFMKSNWTLEDLVKKVKERLKEEE